MKPPRNQSWLAKTLGVSPQYVSDVMRSRYIAAPLAVRLANLLGTNVEYLAPEDDL